ncbi:MAG: hypothetical protein RIT27_866 [Pseudomonadota bacterium]|jgi:hypothetical protein
MIEDKLSLYFNNLEWYFMLFCITIRVSNSHARTWELEINLALNNFAQI